MSGHVEPGRAEPRDTLLLYCPYDRRVTRHARRGSDQLIVCLECGRPVDVPDRETGEAQPDVYEQRTARLAPVVEPPQARRSQARPRQAQTRARWLPITAAVAALVVGVLAAVNVAGNLVATPDTIVPGPGQTATTRNATGSQGSQGGQSTQTAPGAEQSQFVRIANTGGEGAYLRRTTNLDDRLRAWQDNTRLRVIGPDTSVNGTQWKHVEDPAGNQGWIPAEYTRPE